MNQTKQNQMCDGSEQGHRTPDGPVRTHPYTVLLSVLLPVVSRVAEHQQVRRQPIGAAVATLRGDGGDLGPLAQADLQPLVPV